MGGPCADAINTWYGRPDLPIGYQRGHQYGYRNPKDPDRETTSKYAEAVAKAFPHDLKKSSDAPDAAAALPPAARGAARSERDHRDRGLSHQPAEPARLAPGRTQQAGRRGAGEAEGEAMGLHGRHLPQRPVSRRPGRVQPDVGHGGLGARHQRLAHAGRLQRIRHRRGASRWAPACARRPEANPGPRLLPALQRPEQPRGLGPDGGALRGARREQLLDALRAGLLPDARPRQPRLQRVDSVAAEAAPLPDRGHAAGGGRARSSRT